MHKTDTGNGIRFVFGFEFFRLACALRRTIGSIQSWSRRNSALDADGIA